MPNRDRKDFDVTRGGRFRNDPAVPSSFYESEDAMRYWDGMNRFVDYVDSALPAGFSLVNTSTYRDKPVVNKKGEAVSTGKSHERVPSHDFVIQSEDPDFQRSQGEWWSFYNEMPKNFKAVYQIFT